MKIFGIPSYNSFTHRTTMADYDDWVEQAELHDSENPEPFQPPTRSTYRASLMIVEDQQQEQQRKPSVPSDPQSRRPSESRLFPGLVIQTREEKIQSGKEEIKVTVERKWPWAILGVFLVFSGLALGLFGGWCISQDPTGTATPKTTPINACGPGGGEYLGSNSACLFVLLLIVFSFSFQLEAGSQC